MHLRGEYPRGRWEKFVEWATDFWREVPFGVYTWGEILAGELLWRGKFPLGKCWGRELDRYAGFVEP